MSCGYCIIPMEDFKKPGTRKYNIQGYSTFLIMKKLFIKNKFKGGQPNSDVKILDGDVRTARKTAFKKFVKAGLFIFFDKKN